MPFNVTQCPACRSTFNTNSRVLEAAAGRVRCGACLNVFEAIDNFLDDNEHSSIHDASESVFVGNNPQEFFDPSSSLTRSALTEKSNSKPNVNDFGDEQVFHSQLEQEETLSEEFFVTAAEELQGREQLDVKGSVDSSVADKANSSEGLENLEDPNSESLEGLESTHTFIEEPMESEAQSAPDEESHNTEISSQNLGIDEQQPEPPAHSLSQDSQAEEDEQTNAYQSNKNGDEESTEAIRARALETELRDEQALEVIPAENLEALGKMSTPLELLNKRESHLLRNISLFLTILFLGTLLSGQYFWQQMEFYSQRIQLRPAYELLCGIMDCELPAYSNIGAVRSDNLIVRSHPDVNNGLMVNTVIRNTAAFPQAFPLLILSFNSTENNVIALREFTPEEYLDPGLQSIDTMPSMTPVQISLAIMNPGPEAVNYTLSFGNP